VDGLPTTLFNLPVVAAAVFKDVVGYITADAVITAQAVDNIAII
jgi:hypothetical protein